MFRRIVLALWLVVLAGCDFEDRRDFVTPMFKKIEPVLGLTDKTPFHVDPIFSKAYKLSTNEIERILSIQLDGYNAWKPCYLDCVTLRGYQIKNHKRPSTNDWSLWVSERRPRRPDWPVQTWIYVEKREGILVLLTSE